MTNNQALSKSEIDAVLIERHGEIIQSKIKNTTVGIAGLGGLGSNVALTLARLGIGKLIVADFDKVEPSNLNRQQYFLKHLGMKKVDAIEDVIKECNPFIEIQKKDVLLQENNIQDIFRDADIIVEAFDNPKCKAELTNTVLTKMKDKKLVVASGMAGYKTGNTILSRKLKENLYFIGDGKSESNKEMGLMAPRVSIAANHQANTVLRIILEEE